jgi:hypothetical protein
MRETRTLLSELKASAHGSNVLQSAHRLVSLSVTVVGLLLLAACDGSKTPSTGGGDAIPDASVAPSADNASNQEAVPTTQVPVQQAPSTAPVNPPGSPANTPARAPSDQQTVKKTEARPIAPVASTPTTAPNGASGDTTKTQPVADSRPPAQEARYIIARNTSIRGRPVRGYCASELRKNGRMELMVPGDTPLPGGGTLPAGTRLIGRVLAREPGSEERPDRVEVGLQSIVVESDTLSASSSASLIEMRRPPVGQTALKYGLVGALAGATIAVVLRENVAAGAAMGGAAGGAVGVTRAARADLCLNEKETLLDFRLTKDIPVP